MVARSRALFFVPVLVLVISATAVLITGMSSGPRAADAEPTREQLRASPSRLPLYFIENRGQVEPQVDYYLRGAEVSAFFTSGGLTLSLQKGDWALRLAPVGAEATEPTGAAQTPATVSYFRGAPEEWVTGLQTYSGVAYRELWPGIDLVYSGDATRLKYRFVVQPGADPSDIRLAWEGATGLSLNERGQLEVSAGGRTLIDQAPISYQDAAGGRVSVPTSYAVSSGSQFGFRVGAYDPARRLVIDPALVYSGYIGGADGDEGEAIAVDPDGNAYVTGRTLSDATTFPDTVGPDLTYNSTAAFDYDAFVAKVDPTGTTLLYAGYIGGAESDEALAIAVGVDGSAYVGGQTESDEATFPVSVGPDLMYNDDGPVFERDAFVAKVNPAGTGLVYAGYIGGNDPDSVEGIAVDATGSAYVVGSTLSDEATFPEETGPDLTFNSVSNSDDAFVAKVEPTGAGLIYAGYIGGAEGDFAPAVDVDQTGNAYIFGGTRSDQASFPVAVGPDLTYNGGADTFVAKVAPSGASLVYAGYLGGVGSDNPAGLALGHGGTVHVGGSTESTESSFPVTVGPDLTFNDTSGESDGFVASVDASGTALLYAGYIGGGSDDDMGGIAIDPAGSAYAVGETESRETTFPVVDGPDLTHNGTTPGDNDAFVAKVTASGGGLVYSGYIGGADSDRGHGIAVDAGGNAYVVGLTSSDQTTFPIVVGPDGIHNGSTDAFVAKVETTETCQGKLVTHLGSNLNDALTGTSKADVVKALGGKDTIRAKNGKDRVCAGKGNDTAKGGGGADRLKGEGGRDSLVGGGGKDRCVGGPGKDTGKACEKGKI